VLGIAQKEDPTRVVTLITAHIPVGTRSVKAPFDDALTALVAPVCDRIVNDALGIGIGGVPSMTTIPLIVPVSLPTWWVAPSVCGEDEHPVATHITPTITRPEHRRRTGSVCHVHLAETFSS
jgi:hypothetical protein